MSVCVRGQLRREPFLRAGASVADEASDKALLQSLIGHAGSATRRLESMAGASIAVHVIEQGVRHELPSELEGSLPGRSFLRRVTTLEAQGQVLLDSIAYIAVDALPRTVLHELEQGVRPIGHLIAGLWRGRTFRALDAALLEQLWALVGHPDPQASRSSCIHTQQGPCIVLAETFRRGVLAASPQARPLRWRQFPSPSPGAPAP